MSHPQSDFKTDVRHDVHSSRQDHISAARDQVFDYGQNSGLLSKTFVASHEGSVDRDGAGHVAALNFDHNSIYGDKISGATETGRRSREQYLAGDDEDQARSRGKTNDQPRDNRRSGSKLAGGTDDLQSHADNMASGAGDQPKGSLSNFGNGRQEYSEQLPDNWGSMSDLERQAWQAQFKKRANEAMGIRNEPRLGVDPETGIWMGYAGEQPTEAEKEQMRKIEQDPRRPHAV